MGTRIRMLLVAAAVVFGFATSTAAQDGPIHRGIVYDDAGAPLPGAVVTITDPREMTVRVVVTDQWGEYALALDPEVRYEVQITHPAFRKARLQAIAGEHLNVTLKARRSSPGGQRLALAAARR